MAIKIKYPFVLDVSGWKGEINWRNVHPRPNLVICQASTGRQEFDDLLPFHWDCLKNLHIKRGAYHVFDPQSDSQLQIANYLNAIEHAGGFDNNCIPPILVVSNLQGKNYRNALGEKIQCCLNEMESLTGLNPIIQISRRHWGLLKNRSGAYPDWANQYSLWVPWFPSDPNIYKRPPLNTFPKDWDEWAIWGYDEFATLPGINGYVSLSTLSEDYAAQLGIPFENTTITSYTHKQGSKFEATIVSREGVIVRRQSHMNSKMLAFLSKGSKIVGESVEFINAYEAWLQVTQPVPGWCPIVHTGRTYLSIDN